ncbi:uncharacterized protein Fot_50196 [Forsythia ovata]|uniref:Uncharacterized protein n=1 Tax=Forsythia ovata TaxID=205694 RepID=A0ABD1PXF8_9LAMI
MDGGFRKGNGQELMAGTLRSNSICSIIHKTLLLTKWFGWGDYEAFFGDSFFVNKAFSPTDWGDYEENIKILTNSTSANHVELWEHNWGNAFPNATPIGWTWFCNNAWNFNGGSGHAGYAPWIGGWNNA